MNGSILLKLYAPLSNISSCLPLSVYFGKPSTTPVYENEPSWVRLVPLLDVIDNVMESHHIFEQSTVYLPHRTWLLAQKDSS